MLIILYISRLIVIESLMANSKVEIKKIVAEFLKSNLITTPVDDLLNFLRYQYLHISININNY